jgi:hypothetical protein
MYLYAFIAVLYECRYECGEEKEMQEMDLNKIRKCKTDNTF